jgi:recombination protein RecT
MAEQPVPHKNQIVPYQERVSTIRQLLIRSKGQIALAAPKHLDVDKLIRLAMTSIQKTPALLDCTQTSLIAAVMAASALGLEIGLMGQADLVPFKGIVQLIPGYRGLAKIARNSGEISDIYCRVVYSKDFFEWQEGTTPFIRHVPYWPKDPETAKDADFDRGRMIAVYSVCKFKDPQVAASVDVMTKPDVDRIRAMSKQANGTAWSGSYDEMARKTVFRRHSKWLPASVELAKAIELADAVEQGISQDLGNVIEISGEAVDTTTGEIQEEKPKSALEAATEKLKAEAPQPVSPEPVPPSAPASTKEPWMLAAEEAERGQTKAAQNVRGRER